MPFPKTLHRLITEVSVYPSVAVQQNIFREALEFVSKPMVERDSETLFRPLENVLVKLSLSDALEEVLRLIVLELQKR